MSVAHIRTMDSVLVFLTSAGSVDDLATVKPALSVSFAVMLNEAKTSRLMPEVRGRGQLLEVEAKAEAKKYV